MLGRCGQRAGRRKACTFSQGHAQCAGGSPGPPQPPAALQQLARVSDNRLRTCGSHCRQEQALLRSGGPSPPPSFGFPPALCSAIWVGVSAIRQPPAPATLHSRWPPPRLSPPRDRRTAPYFTRTSQQTCRSRHQPGSPAVGISLAPLQRQRVLPSCSAAGAAWRARSGARKSGGRPPRRHRRRGPLPSTTAPSACEKCSPTWSERNRR